MAPVRGLRLPGTVPVQVITALEVWLAAVTFLAAGRDGAVGACGERP